MRRGSKLFRRRITQALTGQTPKYLIRDHESKFGPCFARVAATSGINILKTPYHAPRANAICERFLGSIRRECLDQMLILSEKQLHRVLLAYVEYFNRIRPRSGIHQRVPERAVTSVVEVGLCADSGTRTRN